MEALPFACSSGLQELSFARKSPWESSGRVDLKAKLMPTRRKANLAFFLHQPVVDRFSLQLAISAGRRESRSSQTILKPAEKPR
jgi:hypothetical protein